MEDKPSVVSLEGVKGSTDSLGRDESQLMWYAEEKEKEVRGNAWCRVLNAFGYKNTHKLNEESQDSQDHMIS